MAGSVGWDRDSRSLAESAAASAAQSVQVDRVLRLASVPLGPPNTACTAVQSARWQSKSDDHRRSGSVVAQRVFEVSGQLSGRRQRAVFALVGFLVTEGVARTTTFLLHRHAGSSGGGGGVVIGGTHVHHYMFGIVAVFVAALCWMNEIGVGDGSVAASRSTSALFGIGTALILDEFALLLDLRDVYWKQDGYTSFPALTTFAAVLLLATLGRRSSHSASTRGLGEADDA